jgi:A/G-specific adenine glycosylase
LLAIVRDADGPVELALLAAAWDDDEQRERALRSLIADGLVQPTTGSSRAPAQPRVQLPA